MRQAIGHAQRLNDPLERAQILGLIAVSGHSVLDRAEIKTLADEVIQFGRESDDPYPLRVGSRFSASLPWPKDMLRRY